MVENFEAAKAVLDPYATALSRAMHSGFNRYREFAARDKIDLRPATKAGVVHDFQVREIEQVAVEFPGLKLNKFGELSLLLIDNQFAVKIKKFDQNRKSRSYPTQQAKDFLSQNLKLPGISRTTNLELGYTLDLLGDMEDVFIVCPNGKYDNFWEWGIDSGYENVVQLRFDRHIETREEEQEKEEQERNRYSAGVDEDDEEEGDSQG